MSIIARQLSASTPGAAPAGSALLDELSISLDSKGAVIRRVPVSPAGQLLSDQSRCLLSSLTPPLGSGLARLVSLLERVEDLKHVLLWGPPKSAGGRREHTLAPFSALRQNATTHIIPTHHLTPYSPSHSQNRLHQPIHPPHQSRIALALK